jgi:hypothetical protein
MIDGCIGLAAIVAGRELGVSGTITSADMSRGSRGIHWGVVRIIRYGRSLRRGYNQRSGKQS